MFATIFVIPEDKIENNESKEKEKSDSIITIVTTSLTSSSTWICIFVIMSGYTLWCTANGYIGTYCTRVLGISANLSSTLSIVRSYVIVFLAGFTGGFIIDKFKTKGQGMMLVFLAGAISIAAVLFTSKVTAICIIITIVLAYIVNVLKSTYWSILGDAGIPVVYIPSSNSIDGIYKDIAFIAELVGAKDKGDEMIASMKKEVDSIKEIGSKIKDKKKVYFEIGPAPTLYSVGKDTFINEMIQTIGAENIFANQDAWISPSEESVIDANPDVILTNVNYVENPTKEIMSRDGWDNITAVKEKAVYSIDANSSSRPTQNIIKALKEMAKAVYPEHYEK